VLISGEILRKQSFFMRVRRVKPILVCAGLPSRDSDTLLIIQI
jgi:hypothetical protein